MGSCESPLPQIIKINPSIHSDRDNSNKVEFDFGVDL